MRAILINAFEQKMEEINLPDEVSEFQKEIRNILRTNTIEIAHCNELLTVIFDGAAFTKDTPSFWSELLKEYPIFGNVICVGRHPITQNMEDIYHEYGFENFKVRWCDMATTEHYRKIVTEFASSNRI
jgi:hypothetical protein